MNKKNGYTLAEVLVTLAMLGVITAITLPVINQVRPNQEMIMFKKSYFNLARVVSELINDEDLYPDRDDNPAGSGFSNISIRDLTDGVREAMFNGLPYAGMSKFCGLLAAKMSANDANCADTISLRAGGNFTTPDGVLWSVPNTDFRNYFTIIGIDTNGSRRGQNCVSPVGNNNNAELNAANAVFCAEGQTPDQMYVRIGRFGEVSILGDVEREYIRSNKTSKTYQQIRACTPNCD